MGGNFTIIFGNKKWPVDITKLHLTERQSYRDCRSIGGQTPGVVVLPLTRAVILLPPFDWQFATFWGPTAEKSHDRVMILPPMGRQSRHIGIPLTGRWLPLALLCRYNL